ncbi:hypothetical protein CpPA04_0888 [Corynebacterium pseudotuberculosis]|nr:hypothetical protein CpPA04_0888 [Corynebacterium pseudotuberculosis]ATQ65212.1 Hypothetical protein CpPA07_0904 [Corynebacterium pseudotuberculosis]
MLSSLTRDKSHKLKDMRNKRGAKNFRAGINKHKSGQKD